MNQHHVPTREILARYVLDETLTAQQIAAAMETSIVGVLWACSFYDVHRPRKTLDAETLSRMVMVEGRHDSDIALTCGYGARQIRYLRERFRIGGAKPYATRPSDPAAAEDREFRHDDMPRPTLSDDEIAALYRGRRYEDAVVPMRVAAWRGSPVPLGSMCGCAAAMCAI